MSPLHTVGALLALLALLAGACAATGTAASSPPGLALSAYVDAIRAEDAESAHGLLSETLSAEVSVEELGRLMGENREELSAQASEIEAGANRIQAVAEQPLTGGERVRMILEDGRWAIDGGVLSAPGLRSPMATVRAFRRALQRRSMPGVTRVLSRQPRAELEAEVTRILEETEDELDLEVEIRGNRARVRTTGGREITMVREAGEWRIVAID